MRQNNFSKIAINNTDEDKHSYYSGNKNILI